MGYTTGTANNIDTVKTALTDACVTGGWMLTGDELSKDGIFVQVQVVTSPPEEVRIELLGRTAAGAGDAPNVVAMRRMKNLMAPAFDEILTFPLQYHIFVFSNNEVFMVINYSSDIYQWMAFGQSNQPGLPGTGNWVAASLSHVSPTAGVMLASDGAINYVHMGNPAPMWSVALDWPERRNYWVHNAIDPSYPWSCGQTNTSRVNTIMGIAYLTELIDASPNAFNNESVLLPIRAYKFREASKWSQILEIKNARHLRIDNYTPKEIITLGNEQWMVFPFYRKKTTNDAPWKHSYLYGWAIKYEGAA